MIKEIIYENHHMFAIEFMGDWILYLEYAPKNWIESKEIFLNPDDALLYGKEQIDILLSKAPKL